MLIVSFFFSLFHRAICREGEEDIKTDFRKTGSHLNLGCLRNLKGKRGWRGCDTAATNIFQFYVHFEELPGSDDYF